MDMKRKEIEHFLCNLDIGYLNGTLDDIYDCLQKIVIKEISDFGRKHPEYEILRENIKFEWTYYDEVDFDLHVVREETEDEYNKRIEKARKAKESRERKAAERKRKKEKLERKKRESIEEKEREEYLRLKEKFGDL